MSVCLSIRVRGSLRSSRFLSFFRRRRDRTSERKAGERRTIKYISKQPERWSCWYTLDQYSDLANRLHKCNEEYRGRNRHNVERFLRRCEGARLGWAKKLGRSREGVSKKGEGVGRKSPPPPTAYFATLSQFSSRSQAFGKGKETAATQARYGEGPSEFERGTFFALHVYKRVEISQVEVYKRVGKSVYLGI